MDFNFVSIITGNDTRPMMELITAGIVTHKFWNNSKNSVIRKRNIS